MTRDERILKYSQNLNTIFFPRYISLFKNLAKDWMPIYGYRTMDEQSALYMQGRSTPGKVVTQSQAGDSAHNYGCAVDIALFNPDGSILWEHTRWQEVALACKVCALDWGGNFKNFQDRPHVQLPLKVDYVIIGNVYRTSGIFDAMDAITKNVIR